MSYFKVLFSINCHFKALKNGHVPFSLVLSAKDLTSSLVDVKDDLCEEVASRFNKSLTFDPSDLKMAYAVRDPVATGTVLVHSDTNTSKLYPSLKIRRGFRN